MWAKTALSLFNHRFSKVAKTPIFVSIPLIRNIVTLDHKSVYEEKTPTTTTAKRIQPVKMSFSSFESGNSSDLYFHAPIIIMHGLLGSRQNWASLSKVIHTKMKAKVISVDARNHGDSPHSSQLTYEHMAEDVHHLMNDLKIPKATLIGHSMGGRTMMTVALKYPRLVNRLVVVDISPIGLSANLTRIPQYFNAMKQVTLEPNLSLSAARKQADEQMAETIEDVNMRRFLVMNLVESQRGHFNWRVNLNVLMNKFGDIASFPRFQTSFDRPTLFLGGSRSDYIRQEDHLDIRRFFPKAEFKYVDGAGHWVHAEKPSEFVNLVCEFLQR